MFDPEEEVIHKSLPPGWAIKRAGSRYHYFVGTRALCSHRLTFVGPVTPERGTFHSMNECSECRAMLNQRILSGVPA